MKSRRLKFGLTLVLPVVAACLITNQDAETVFESGTLPAVLGKLANPKPVGVDQADQDKLLVDVAVIDNGVDYMHEKLRDKIRYTFDKQGNVIAAGHDFFGKDRWGSPVLIDPIPFSFGAKLTAEGKIEAPLKDPLKKLDQLNDQFMAKIEEAIGKSAKLKNSLFSRIDRTSFHLLGAYQFLVGQEDENATDYLKLHKSKKSRGLQIQAAGFDQEDWDESDKYSEGFLRTIVAKPWKLSSSRPWPDFSYGNAFYYLEGYPEFEKILRDTFTNFDRETNFVGSFFARYLDYRYLLSSSKSRGKNKLRSSVINDLYSQWHKMKTQHIDSDPYLSFVRSFCASLSDLDYMKFIGTLSEEAKKREFNRLFERAFKDYEAYAKFVLADKRKHLFDARTRRTTRKSLRKLNAAKPWMLKMLEARGRNLLLCDTRRFKDLKENPFRDKYLDYYTKVGHPYLHSDSASESHGTHVSSLVTAQSEGIGIVPVRVMTSSFNSLPKQDVKQKKEFWREFEAWLGKDYVYPATVKLLRDSLDSMPKGSKGPQITGKEQGKDRAAGVKVLGDILSPALAEEFDRRKLAFYFVPQLIEGIKYVGRERILIGANISLGVGTELPVTPTVKDDEVEVIQKLDFLAFEFFKYQIGAALIKDAPNTLFIVAAGNDSAWMDGESRSGLPCDVGSPFLGEFVKKGQPQPPNNQVKNILCVGSINPAGKMSPFSNWSVSTRVKFIVSYGEAVRAMIRTTDCSGINTETYRKYGGTPYIDSYSLNIEEFIGENGGFPENLNPKQKKKFIRKWKERLAVSGSILSGIHRTARAHACVNAKDDKLAKFTGTSMASPIVSGRVAKRALAKMTKAGLAQKDAYGHKDFMPEVLIAELQQDSPRCSDLPDHPFHNVRAVKGVNHMSETCMPERYPAIEPFRPKTKPKPAPEEPEVSKELKKEGR